MFAPKKTLASVLVAGIAICLNACGDENTTTVYETEGLEVLAKGDSLAECTKAIEGKMVYVTDSSAVYYCADSSWAVLNGEDGQNGEDGKDGQDGKDGEDGKNGTDGKDGQDGQKGDKGDDGDDGTSCTAKSISEGVEVSCGGIVVDTIVNGKDGQDGAKGDDGDDGTSCTAKSISEGVEVSCDGIVVDTIVNGKDGQKGDDCSLTDNDDGTVSVTCGGNTTTLYKAMCGATAYDPSAKFCVGVNLYDLCGGKSYDPAKQICDTRDNKIYKIVTIGSQTWMAENLNYADSVSTPNLEGSSWCYENSADSCAKYGRLYTWAAAMDSAAAFSNDGKGCGDGVECTTTEPVRGICPDGWHLPSSTEWSTLFAAVGGSSTAGKMLKSSSGWNSSGNGTDSYGFSALPAGLWDNHGYSSNAGDGAFFWSSTGNDSGNASRINLDGYDDNAYLDIFDKNYGFAVRCLKN